MELKIRLSRTSPVHQFDFAVQSNFVTTNASNQPTVVYTCAPTDAGEEAEVRALTVPGDGVTLGNNQLDWVFNTDWTIATSSGGHFITFGPGSDTFRMANLDITGSADFSGATVTGLPTGTGESRQITIENAYTGTATTGVNISGTNVLEFSTPQQAVDFANQFIAASDPFTAGATTTQNSDRDIIVELSAGGLTGTISIGIVHLELL